MTSAGPGPRPPWLRVRFNDSDEFQEVARLTRRLRIGTVCQEARCPNLHECWGRERTATFMIMGDTCSRRCTFCSVQKGTPPPLDPRGAQRNRRPVYCGTTRRRKRCFSCQHWRAFGFHTKAWKAWGSPL